MHNPANHQSPPPPRASIWVIAGTGDGQRLAMRLLEQGWQVLVSVVTDAAAGQYPNHGALELEVGAIDGPAGIRARLQQAADRGWPLRAVVDASHPFATRISAALAEVWNAPGAPAASHPLPPLLRLRRPQQEPAREAGCNGTRLLSSLEELAGQDLDGAHLLLAIGARQLRRAVTLTPTAVHHARLLPNATALQQGQAAGIPAAHLACLRPGSGTEPALLRALLRQWRISHVLCRQSGGITETLWRQLCTELGLTLLLLERPAEPAGTTALELEPLLLELNRLQTLPPRRETPPDP